LGDSAPYGVHAPVERWFGGASSGLWIQILEVEKIRDRNVKWKKSELDVLLLRRTSLGQRIKMATSTFCNRFGQKS